MAKDIQKSFWGIRDELLVIQKNTWERIHVCYCERDGDKYYDFRIFKRDEYGAYNPTVKGVVIPSDSMTDIIEAINNKDKNIEK